MHKILILGASGLVGRALVDEFIDEFDLYGTYFSSLTSLPNDMQFQLEVQQLEKLKGIIRTIEPDIVISCIRGEFDQQLKFHEENWLKNYKIKAAVFITFLPQMYLMATLLDPTQKQIYQLPNQIMGNSKLNVKIC